MGFHIRSHLAHNFPSHHFQVTMSANIEIYPAVTDEKHAVAHVDEIEMVGQKVEAISAEEVEHSMGIWDAVRAYPMGCFWAFVISFCIVSSPYTICTRPKLIVDR